MKIVNRVLIKKLDLKTQKNHNNPRMVYMNKNLLILPLVAAVIILIFPFIVYSGDKIMIITTTSMLPVLYPNDMIIVKPATVAQVQEGDIIAFNTHMEIGIVAHRAIAIYDNHGEMVIDTKGDNNESEDPWYVTDDDLIGLVDTIIPKLGILLVAPVRFALVAVIIISALSLLKDKLTENKKKET